MSTRFTLYFVFISSCCLPAQNALAVDPIIRGEKLAVAAEVIPALEAIRYCPLSPAPLGVPLVCPVTAQYQPTPFRSVQARGVHVVDGWITNVYYDRQFVADDKLQIGGWGDTYNSYIKFDLTGLPKNVTQAVLGLMPYSRGDSSTSVAANFYLVRDSWAPSMSWATQPAATMIGTMPAPTPNQWWAAAVTSQYNAWQDGSNENHGFRIQPQANQNNFNVFRSSRFVNDASRPMLQLKFTPPAATPDLRIPLPGNMSWLVTTEIGGYDCKGTFNEAHDGKNYFSIDFSWRNRDAAGEAVYDSPAAGGAIPVLAAAAGRVVTTSVDDPNPANGNYVVLDHDDDANPDTGLSTRYLHLKEPPLVSAGDLVQQGGQIGWMGDTGATSNGDHLHFGVRFNGDGSASQIELSYVTMERRLLKSFQTECSLEAPVDYVRYHRSSNRAELSPSALPSFTAQAVVDPWTYEAGLSPGGWAIIVGQHLSGRTEAWTTSADEPLPTTLGGVTVWINGSPAILSHVSETLVRLLVPGTVQEGAATVVVDRDGVLSDPVTVEVKRALPAIFSVPVRDGQNYSWYVTAALSDSSQLVGTRRADSRVARGARPGESIDLYVLGLGRTVEEFPTDRAFSGAFQLADSVQVALGQSTITPDLAVLISPGLYLVRVKIPSEFPGGDAPLRIVSRDIASSSIVYLTVETVTQQVTLTGLTVSPSSLVGGESATGQITLSDAAPANGAEVQLTSSIGAVRLPASVRVPAGQRSLGFSIATAAVNSAQSATITATFNNVQRTATLTVQPAGLISPFRDYEITIKTTFSIDGNSTSPRIITGFPLADMAEVNTSGVAFDPSSRVILLAYFSQPSHAANSSTYRASMGNYTNLTPGSTGSGAFVSGGLVLAAQSPNVGTAVTGTLQFSTATRSFSVGFTGTITASRRIR